ncbi:MAG TPA: Rrf2 family transcriptional regulator [Sedimentisphaerales bacterium]|nr:Rrf2 family transcriptional regulator [Sedimentisphaerales bacterium]
MKLSTRTRYAVRAMIELAQNEANRPLQLKIIAKRQDISIKYLEQLMAVLRSAGLIRSVRGSRGGYTLARAANQIGLSDILHCLEGAITTVECVEDGDRCARAAECAARQVWMKVQQAIDDVLQSITLQDVVDMAKDGKHVDYQI